MSTMPKSDAEYTDTREREIQVRRVAAASLVGTTIEWYDFLVYATTSGVIFNRCFLAERSIFVNTLVAHGTFAAGFLCARSADCYLAISEPHRPKTSACPCTGNHGHCHHSDRPFAHVSADRRRTGSACHVAAGARHRARRRVGRSSPDGVRIRTAGCAAGMISAVCAAAMKRVP